MPRFGDRRPLRIGLLGGSFNPAHAGHAHIASAALRRLRLDQIWLLVSPGNPLKNGNGMAPLAARLASARAIADGRRIVATAIETALGTRYTADTLAQLRRRFPRARFVWLMGADNLAQLPRWNRWRAITRLIPIAVLPRPGETRRALAGAAAQALRRSRMPPRRAATLAALPAPAWAWLPIRENPLSATALRAHAKSRSRGEFP
ncbi:MULTISPECIES: nicotinate-nucleotide adenylyltransferase [Acidiphilium]|uniref:Probable nicotinate-nucleotide adenylyltransferase n=1 Tax=Acidiphilium iwatense TaxID=768198 RepID=A0ABS9DZA6_9PROT|nr:MULTISPECIES: nicotinate-nucleotide adenylyltransferase [Acidiphilium]MCF3946679.1 nicotinate-nucleotide adenylyltransferase [Acidiphilium iwatense]